MNAPHLALIILAAGKGTRMKSDKAKVLHEVFHAPMIHHVLQATLPLAPAQTVAIVGHQKEAVMAALAPFKVSTVTQLEQLGTGHAVAIAESAITSGIDTVMVLCGDTPLIRPETLAEMYDSHMAHGSALTVMTTLLENPANYGRILTDDTGGILGIVEEKDATVEQREIREINAGIYCVNRRFLFQALGQVDRNNSQGEIYLTDIVAIGVRESRQVRRYVCPKATDVLGVNSRVELAQAQSELQMRRNISLMLQGISMQGPESIAVAPEAVIGRDTLLMAGVQIYGKSDIGGNCIIGHGAILTNCQVGEGATIGPYAVLTGCTVPAGATVAPHSVTC